MSRTRLLLYLSASLLVAAFYYLPGLQALLPNYASNTPISIDRIIPWSGSESEAGMADVNGEYFSRFIRQCKPREHTLKETSKQAVFTWKDAKGKTHFGDRAPEQGADKVKLRESVAKQFSLSIHDDGQIMPLDYRDQLEVRIRKSYSIIAELLPRAAVKNSDVQLWVFDSWLEYEKFRKQYAPDLVGGSSGFHSGNDNVAAVHHKTDAQLMSTSVHEAAHVINTAVLGYIPRWLNEGLAEYLEPMKVYGQASEIPTKAGWIELIKKSSLSLEQVLQSQQLDWSGGQQQALYAKSWGFVFYMMSNNDTRTLFKAYLAETANTPCEELDFIAFADANFTGGFTRLSAGFTYWQPSTATTHVY